MDHRQTLSGHEVFKIKSLTPISRSFLFTELLGLDQEAVESVLQQSYRSSELIVANDGSTDDTVEVIRPFGDRLCYVEKANGGKASAVNLGLKYVTGDYV